MITKTKLTGIPTRETRETGALWTDTSGYDS